VWAGGWPHFVGRTLHFRHGPSLPRIKTRQIGPRFQVLAAPPRLPPSAGRTACAGSPGTVETGRQFLGRSSGRRGRASPAASSLPTAQPLHLQAGGCSASRQPSPVLQPALQTATQLLGSPAAARFFSVARSPLFSSIFPGCVPHFLGPKRRRGLAVAPQPGRRFTVSPLCPRCGSPAPAGRTGPLGQCKLLFIAGRRLSSARGGDPSVILALPAACRDARLP